MVKRMSAKQNSLAPVSLLKKSRLQCRRDTPCPAFPVHGVAGPPFFSSLPVLWGEGWGEGRLQQPPGTLGRGLG
jgi:hypothetical protein